MTTPIQTCDDCGLPIPVCNMNAAIRRAVEACGSDALKESPEVQAVMEKERERGAALEMLLARLLVLSPGSSEDGLDAIGGWGRLHALMGEYRAANPEAP